MHCWTQHGLADLRPFFKPHRLARPHVEVVLNDRKKELVTTQPGDQGPRRVTRKEIEDAFAQGWVVESVEPSRYEVRPDPNDISFRDGGPKAWFVVARRGNRQ